MNIDFQLPVITRGVLAGRTKSRPVMGTVPVSMNLREVQPSDVNAVVSVYYPPGAVDVMSDYFQIGGKIFVRLGRASELENTFAPYAIDEPGFAFIDVSRKIRLWVDNYVYNGEGLFPPTLANARKNNLPLHPTPLAELRLLSFNEEPVAMQIASFSERCDRLVVSSGDLFGRVAEPVLAVDFHRRDGRVAASVFPITRSFNGFGKGPSKRKPPFATFRLDEMDRAREFCVSVGVSEDRLPVTVPGRIVVHDCVRLSVDSDKTSLYAAASRLTQEMYGKDWMPDTQLVDKLFSLVEKFTEDDCPDELGDILAGLVDLHRSGTRAFRSQLDLQATEQVVRMWDDRLIDMPSANLTPRLF